MVTTPKSTCRYDMLHLLDRDQCSAESCSACIYTASMLNAAKRHPSEALDVKYTIRCISNMASNNQQTVKCTSVIEHMHLLYATAGMVICSQYMYLSHLSVYTLH